MLFGSAATGSMRQDSDIDIAIIPHDPSMTLADELTLQTELVRTAGRSVDLVRLDRAPTMVRWQVARHGRSLYQGAPFEASRFVAAATAEYLDFAPAFKRAAERFRKRLASGARGFSP